jgi:1-acyl-sn-glycerol-3-phosphate acyltransferase
VHAVVPEARFVSKADVKSWPLVSRLVDAAGTLYLEREKKRDALRVVHAVAAALAGGEVVAIFPEGTTSTGHGLLPFHANLLQAAIATATPVQPVALRYADAAHAVSEAVEFIGDTGLFASLWRTSCGEGVRVRLTFVPPRASAGVERRASRASCARTSAARSASLPAKPSGRGPAQRPRRRHAPPPPGRRGSSCGSASASRRARRRAGCRSGCDADDLVVADAVEILHERAACCCRCAETSSRSPRAICGASSSCQSGRTARDGVLEALGERDLPGESRA